MSSVRTQIPVTIGWITVISTLLFIPFLGGIPLFDWDEVNFAEVAREMILTGDYTRAYIDFTPFWEKPPFFFWLQAISMHLWGIGEFAARFPNALCGVLTLCVLYLLGRKLYDHRFGLLWLLAYAGSILPHLYFRSGIIDPWFNLFIFISIYCLIRSTQAGRMSMEGLKGGKAEGRKGGKEDRVFIVCGGILLGLAVLTKGPVAYLIVLLVVGVYWVTRRLLGGHLLKGFVLYSVVAGLTFGLWYGIDTLRHGPWFITEFTRYQWELFVKPGAGHAGFPGYHVVVLLLGCFPASILSLRALFAKKAWFVEGERISAVRSFELRHLMAILLIVVVVLFSFVQSKIVHYSSLCYFPLTFLAALYLWQLHKSGERIGNWQRAGIVCLAALYAIAGLALVVIGRNPELINDLVTDVNAKASLTLHVSWEWWRALPVVFLLAAIASLISAGKYKNVVIMYVFTGLFVASGIYCWAGNVQQYSQGPASEFFASMAGKDVYMIPWGYKSYSQFWDFKKPKPPEFNPKEHEILELISKRNSDPDYLLSPGTDKDVYVVTKVSKVEEFQKRYPDVQKIGVRGGFAFYRWTARTVETPGGNR